jgi:hypothetical protein
MKEIPDSTLQKPGITLRRLGFTDGAGYIPVRHFDPSLAITNKLGH